MVYGLAESGHFKRDNLSPEESVYAARFWDAIIYLGYKSDHKEK